MRILIIQSSYYQNITDALFEGARKTLNEAQITGDSIDRIFAPGAFELAFLAKKAAETQKYSAIICLGCVIRGGTPHFEFVCSETARGIMSVNLNHDTPVIFGVLTTDHLEQALERSTHDINTNKGVEAANAALLTLKSIKQLDSL